MKTAKMFLVTLAALSMAACSNNDEMPGMNNDGTKSVSLRLDGLATSSRAIGDAQSAGKIALSNLTVYFTDGTNILAKKSLSTANAAEWAELTGEGHVFHQLPSAVSQIQIVGNSTGKTITEGTVAALKASVLKAAGEQEFTNVTLFGEDTSLESQAPQVSDDHTDDVLKAEVPLSPLVARFEIGNIACTDLGTGPVKQFDLSVIGLMDFNSGVTLAGTASGTEYTLDNVLEPGSQVVQGKVIFGEADENAGWAWDKISGATITTTTPWNPGVSGDKKFVYQFIPNKLANGKMAQVKLVLDNVKWTDGTNNPFNSVVTAKFQKDGEDLTAFQAGKIYTVDYQFRGENVGPWNPDDVKCVQINVTVANWEVVALTPVFE